MSNEDRLTPAERELEAALRSLRPAPARINPVAAALAAGRRTAPRRVHYWQVAAAAAVVIVAVGGAWLALGRRGEAPDQVVRQDSAVQPELAVAVDLPTEPPTLAIYRQALAQSPAALDALLDRQAIAGGSRSIEFTPVATFTLWNADLHSPLGEM
jgi:hypothetical protein